ncbi:ABC transporter permease subunit [Mesorhizobium sp. M7A.F.Ca.US.014.04.1.1]|nr:ABC transporter permease subunit [Mesorhizobium sp. M7A.F.Ca.US.014.04.1.1]
MISYLLPLNGINVAPILAAIIALTLNTIAFQAEIFRGGLLAIPRGQLEAARMVGIRKWAARQHILVPQILRLVIPSLVNETISILKNSSLVSVIAVTELMRVSQQIVATTYRPFEIYIAAAIIYIVINFLLSLLGRMAEQRLARRA